MKRKMSSERCTKPRILLKGWFIFLFLGIHCRDSMDLPPSVCLPGPLYQACNSLVTLDQINSNWSAEHNKTWLPYSDICTWAGVECNSQKTGVIGLSFIDEEIKNFPASVLQSFPSLEKFQLTYSLVTQLDPELFSASLKLKQIVISNNRALSELPPDIFHPLQNLEMLDLSHNVFKKLSSDTFENLTELKQLYLRRNHLEFIPLDLCKDLSQLTYLDASYNNLGALSRDALKGLQAVEFLDLSNNQFKNLPVDTFFDLANLKELYLHQNSFIALPERLFESNPSLQRVSLAHNYLTQVPELLFKAQIYLSSLDLSGNIIQKYPPTFFAHLPNLQELDLSGDSISQLDPIWFSSLGSLGSLTSLNLSGNGFSLSKDSTIFESLKSLQSLDLGENSFPDTTRLSKTTCSRINLSNAFLYPSFLCDP